MKTGALLLLLCVLALVAGIFLSTRSEFTGPDPVQVVAENERRPSSPSRQGSEGTVPGEPEPKPSSEPGPVSLSITSNPSAATVFLDGHKLGITPLTVPGLEQGEHELRLTREHHYPYEETISVGPGDAASFHAILERGKGGLHIVARPVSARVYLNGALQKDWTPLQIDNLLSGSHKVRVEAERYKPEERAVEVLPGETREVLFMMEGGNLTFYRGEWHEPEKAEKLKEEDVNLLLARARGAMNSGDLTTASRLLKEAVSVLPQAEGVVEALEWLNTLEAEARQRALLQKADKMVRKGMSYEAEAKYEQALSLYREARTVYPEYEGIEALISRLEDKVRQLRENQLTGGMVFVRGGFFMMGCGPWAGDCDEDANPFHQVEVDDFYIGKYEVTQRQWKELMGDNPSHHRGCLDCPVESVGWNEIGEFIRRLSQATGRRYRLPTEAEWEYAARGGGKPVRWSGTNNPDKLDDHAWYWKNSAKRAHLVGTKLANGLGLYDMTGNVEEWCSDFYTATYYRTSPSKNPPGPEFGAFRVVRGGNWNNPAPDIRTVVRYHVTDGARHSGLGFRVVRNADE